jgi:hypothetical protein
MIGGRHIHLLSSFDSTQAFARKSRLQELEAGDRETPLIFNRFFFDAFPGSLL